MRHWIRLQILNEKLFLRFCAENINALHVTIKLEMYKKKKKTPNLEYNIYYFQYSPSVGCPYNIIILYACKYCFGDKSDRHALRY